MNEKQLPPNWVIAISKTYPDKLYYYNKQTKARSWEFPKDSQGNLEDKTSQDQNEKLRSPSKSKVKLKSFDESKRNKDIKTMSNFTVRPITVVKNCSQDKINKKQTTEKIESVGNNETIIFVDNYIHKNKDNSQTLFQSNVKDQSEILLSSIHVKKSKPPTENKMCDGDIDESRNIKCIPKSSFSAERDQGKLSVNRKGIFKKNVAHNRMKSLKKSLRLEVEKEKKDEQQKRLKSLVQTINSPICTKNVTQTMRQNIVNSKKGSENNSKTEQSNVTRISEDHRELIIEEEMEWEPIGEEKIVTEVYQVRQKVCPSGNSEYNLPQNQFQLSSIREKQNLYFVVDTNVFLIDITMLQTLLDAEIVNFGRPFIIIPWTVIQELDMIKDCKTKADNLRRKARAAISFLNNHFSNKHPRVLGQTAEDAYEIREKYDSENSDDSIWQTCLELQNYNLNVVLLTFDKNLQNKATINNIKALGRDSSPDMINAIINIVSSSNDFSNQKNNILGKHFKTDETGMETLIVEDIFTKFKGLVHLFISEILSIESRTVFGDNWAKYMKIKPPWTAKTALKCAELHWIAITSEAFTNRRAESSIKKLQEFINKNIGELKIKDVLNFLNTFNEMIYMLDENKYLNLLEQTNKQIEELKCQCLEEEITLNSSKLEAQIENEKNEGDIRNRATCSLQIFERIYTFYQDVGNKLSTHSYFKEERSFVKDNFSREEQIKLINMLNSLLNALKIALSEINYQRINCRSVISLFNALMIIPLNFNEVITPFDIYCCLKTNEVELKNGVCQYEDILSRFCSLIDYQIMSN